MGLLQKILSYAAWMSPKLAEVPSFVPGPWEVFDDGDASNPAMVRSINQELLVRVTVWDNKESAPTARLIAAAPDLLVAAERLASEYVSLWCHDSGGEPEQCDDAAYLEMLQVINDVHQLELA
jgi:hypothetical protein